MKNLLLIFFLFSLSFNIYAQTQYVRCVTHEYTEQLVAQDPRYGVTLQRNEALLNRIVEQNIGESSAQTVIVIPVVVHVVWNTAAQNISEQMITSQIRVLNEDFRKMAGTPGWNNDPVGADTRIEFRLATVDPNGNPHTGINRVQTSVTSWNYQTQNAQLKATSYWDSNRYLNIWTANLSGGILGYAQFPGGNQLTDGVVILYSAFGYNSPAAPYNLGRTTTHEVGHWINLRHTWGDGDCTVDDGVDDTPLCSGQYFSSVPTCPKPTQCGFVRQIENYMDYSDDGCMNIYTNGQSVRMNAAWQSFRSNLLISYKERLSVSATNTDYMFTTRAGANFAIVNFSTLGSVDSMTVEVFPNYYPPNMPEGKKAVKRYFVLTPKGSGSSGKVRLYYNDSEVINFTNGDNNLKIYKLVGGSWGMINSTGNPTENWVEATGIEPNGIFAIADPNDNPIPVELTSFNALTNERNVTLSWITATESNNLGFEIERAVSSINQNLEWTKIGFVQSSGNSTVANSYSFIDMNLQPAQYLYRLKVVDLDGSISYSNIINVDVNAPANYLLSQNYPNPFNPSTTIHFEVPTRSFISIKIYDAIGNEIRTLVNEEKEAGMYEVSFNASDLTSGIYFYSLNSGNVSITKKMMLMK